MMAITAALVMVVMGVGGTTGLDTGRIATTAIQIIKVGGTTKISMIITMMIANMKVAIMVGNNAMIMIEGAMRTIIIKMMIAVAAGEMRWTKNNQVMIMIMIAGTAEAVADMVGNNAVIIEGGMRTVILMAIAAAAGGMRWTKSNQHRRERQKSPNHQHILPFNKCPLHLLMQTLQILSS